MLFLSSITILLMAYRLWQWKFKRSDYPLSSNDSFPMGTVATCSILLGLLVWSQVKHHRLENRLAKVASELSGTAAQVSCETFLESWMPKYIWFEGYVPHGSGKLHLRYAICHRLTEVIDSPEPQNRFHSTAVVVLTHEAMHIRGITNEAQTECAAIQRAAQAAILLGVPDANARELARTYWEVQYLQIRQAQDSAYYSSECRPKGALDEGLPYPPWDIDGSRE